MRALLRASSSAASSSSIQAASSAKSIEDGSWAEQSRGRRAAGCSAVVRGGGRGQAAEGGGREQAAYGPRPAVGNGRLTAMAKGDGRNRDRAVAAGGACGSSQALRAGLRGEGIRSCGLRGGTRQTGTPFFSPKN
jgi:hypothetical protein